MTWLLSILSLLFPLSWVMGRSDYNIVDRTVRTAVKESCLIIFQTGKVVEVVQGPEMLSLQKMVYVSKSTTVECFAVQLVSIGLVHFMFRTLIT